MKAHEITPKGARCGGLGPCPAIFRTDRKTFVVVGKVPAINELPANIRRKVGKGEVAIEVPTKTLPIE